MSTDDDLLLALGRGEDELRAAAAAADELIADARAAYARGGPPKAGPVDLTPTPTPARRPAPNPRPDRLVTYPLWVLWVVVAHACLAPVLLGVVVTATALLALPAYALDQALLGVPVLTFGAVSVGLLAAAGTTGQVARSARDQLKRCPW